MTINRFSLWLLAPPVLLHDPSLVLSSKRPRLVPLNVPLDWKMQPTVALGKSRKPGFSEPYRYESCQFKPPRLSICLLDAAVDRTPPPFRGAACFQALLPPQASPYGVDAAVVSVSSPALVPAQRLLRWALFDGKGRYDTAIMFLGHFFSTPAGLFSEPGPSARTIP